MRLRSTAAAGVLFAAALSFGMSGTASAADLDCKDFPTQSAAQADLVANPSDPNGLDANDNGVACEDFDYAAAGAPAPVSTTAPTSATTGQVSTRPVGAVAAGDGSSSTDAGALPYVLGGLAFAGAGGAALAARRTRSAA
ncbi:hypothetical protein [Modestobacter italicus]|nr:hypothetical protein [Modestobacter marinus]